MSESVLRCRGLGKTFADGNAAVQVLNGLEFDLKAGERVAIVGSSGSGKSTLLNLLGGLDVPSEGQVIVAGEAFSAMSDDARSRWRNQHLGFVFQFHHLLPEFTALEGVAMPARIAGMDATSAMQSAEQLLTRVGLSHRLHHRPAALSGGERQRVAIARALINAPNCVLMDEPTGNLDPESAAQILALIDDLTEAETAFVIVTHDMSVAGHMDRTLTLRDGKLHLS